MKVLLTGASSFTGWWFARALAESGHVVVAPLRRARGGYTEGVRAGRVKTLASHAELLWETPFGSDEFLAVAAEGGFDVLCHHAAEVGDYRSEAFDVLKAAALNTNRMDAVLRALREGGARACVITGSVFEAGEGAGEAPLRAFSPYAVSKGLTAHLFAYGCASASVRFGKFVIPNPFGPFEEARFCDYLVRTWRRGETAEVRTPDYVRDNVHVGPLAAAYAAFVARVAECGLDRHLAPSQFVETQGQFAQRFAREIGSRLDIATPLRFAAQSEFPEPRVRINTDPIAQLVPDAAAPHHWDRLAEYYAH